MVDPSRCKAYPSWKTFPSLAHGCRIVALSLTNLATMGRYRPSGFTPHEGTESQPRHSACHLGKRAGHGREYWTIIAG